MVQLIFHDLIDLIKKVPVYIFHPAGGSTTPEDSYHAFSFRASFRLIMAIAERVACLLNLAPTC